MLLKDFYSIRKLEKTDETKYAASIFLNSEHAIFKGHFPGNPVTPGVCMMQIIKELCEEVLESPLLMTSSSNVKFMALINPEKNPALEFEIEMAGDLGTEIKVKATAMFATTVALKLTNIYKKA